MTIASKLVEYLVQFDSSGEEGYDEGPMLRMKTLLLLPVLALALAGCGAKPVGLSDDATSGSTNGPAGPSPTVSIAANPTSVASGGAATLTWSSTAAASCSASGAWLGSKATSGSQSTGPLVASGNFSLTCTGAGGSASASATVSVSGTPPPPSVTVSLAANPTSVASGGTSILTWSSTNAASCTASGGWSGAQATSGSTSTGALTSTGLFNLACTGTGGTATATASVLVVPPPGPLPAWVNALAIGQWTEIPNTAMVSVEPSPQPAGTTGPVSKVIAWTSFVADTRTSKVYSVANGGHQDYAGNEVDVLDMERDQPVWSQLLPPTPNSQLTDGQPYYLDGRPAARHTYYGVTLNAIDDRIMLFAGAVWCGTGCGINAISSYNIGSNTYSPSTTHGSVTGVFGVPNHPTFVVDPTTGDVYTMFVGQVARWTRSSNTFDNLLTSNNAPAGGGGAAFDVLRGRILVLGGLGNDHHIYTPSSNSASAVTLSGPNAADVTGGSPQAVFYVPVLDLYFVRTGGAGGTVYQINASTFEVTTFPTAGGGSIPSTFNGPYNKFLYLPRMNGAVYVPCYAKDGSLSCSSGNAWFLRLH